jgi:hypothetical protein
VIDLNITAAGLATRQHDRVDHAKDEYVRHEKAAQSPARSAERDPNNDTASDLEICARTLTDFVYAINGRWQRAKPASPNKCNADHCRLAMLTVSDRAPTATRLKAQVASRLNQLRDTNLRPR